MRPVPNANQIINQEHEQTIPTESNTPLFDSSMRRLKRENPFELYFLCVIFVIAGGITGAINEANRLINILKEE